MTFGKLKYVLDSDTFIRANRIYYPFDFAKPFWNGLIKYAEDGIICSIDKVFNELKIGDDELSEWSISKFKPYFVTTESNEIITIYQSIIGWVQQQDQFYQNAKDEFFEIDNADSWLISFALRNNLTIVTHEIYNPDIKKKVPIPNVCKAFNISYIEVFQMLRDLRFKF